MMFFLFTLLWGCVALVAAGRSPNADYVNYLVQNSDVIGPFISDNLIEDANLDVSGLVQKYNYPLEEHFVTTEDGYVLGMHRIPHGRDENNKPGDRPAVFLMHGLFSSSADWVVMGPGCALGYMLVEAGFDVWMGNARGNYYSRRHLRLNPDARDNTDFWKFSWDEIGNIDVPAMIDYVLEHTGRSGLHYTGLSQGTTVFFVMGSLRPDYNHKIISMHALAPVAYMAHNKNRLFLAIAPYAREIEALSSLIGVGELFPNNQVMTWAGQTFCSDDAITQILCSNLIFLIGGWSVDQHNATMLPVKLGHAPAGGAVRQIVHYGQSITGKEFQRYDHGSIGNLRAYGSLSPPDYDLSQITAPVFLHYAERDPLAELEDVDRLYRELGGPVQKHRVPLETFSHVDFQWGIDANRLVYDLVIDLIKTVDPSINDTL